MTASLLTHRYAPRGACRSVMSARNGEVVLSGPAGTGKSRAALEKLNYMMLKYVGSRGLILRKTQVSLGSTALVTWREHVIPEALLSGEVWFYGGSAEEPAQYRYRNGSRVMIGGMDNPTKIMSSEYDVIYVQEAIELTETDWEHASSRLRNGRMPYQQMLADTNPSTPVHWLKQRGNRGDTRFLESRHTDNPMLYRDDGSLTSRGEAYMAILDRLTGPRRARLRDGKWVAAEGQIWDGWDEALHLVDPFPIPEDWRRVWSVDFGYTHPFVLQMWALDPDGRLVLYREIFRTKRLVEEHAFDVMECVSRPDPDYVHQGHERQRAYQGRIWTERRPDWLVADHDAEGRATLERELGMSTRKAHKAVGDGLQAVASRMKPAGDGRPRLVIQRGVTVHRDQDLVDAMKPTSTVEEIPGYVWADVKRKEEPVKTEDDGCDTMRYVVMELDRPSGSGIRVMGGRRR